MAAIYLHNALYARNPSDHRDILEHSRNLSTVSNTTLVTSATYHSQPTEPLLQPNAPGEAAESYFDQVTQQPRNLDVTPARLQWGDSLTPGADPTVVGEKGRGRGRKSSQWWKRVKEILEVIMAIWAIYNAVCYFLAFSIYTRAGSSMGPAACLALGTSSGLSFALPFCSLLLSTAKHKLHLHGLPFKYTAHICSSLHYLSSICLLGPAAANFALLFVWKNSTNPIYSLNHRCHVDVDVVWSATTDMCNKKSPSTAIWITLSSLRLAVTLVIIVAYHAISLLRPNHRLIHHRLGSEPSRRSTSLSETMLPVNHDLRAQLSDSTLNATLRGDDVSRPLSPLRLAHSRSSGLSADTFIPGESISFGRSVLPESESEHDLNGHIDRFRSLLTEITQETEAVLEFMHAGHASSPSDAYETHPLSLPPPPRGLTPPSRGLPPAYSYDDHDYESDDGVNHESPRGNPNNIFNLPPVPPALGYNEFGLPYPPDQDVPMLNGYIRRMPTIESMGSGEIGTSIGASSHRAGGSIYNSSRPPTRNTLLSFMSYELGLTGSQPPSRSNSLSARTEEHLAGMSNISGTSEHGELQSKSDIPSRRISSPTSFLDSPLPASFGDTHSTGTSRSTTLSYHTATMGSLRDSYPPMTSRPREHEHSDSLGDHDRS